MSPASAKKKAALEETNETPTQTKKAPQKKKAKDAKVKRAVYPNVITTLCHGKTGLTYDQAKQLLGWEEETEKISFGKDSLFTHNGKKVRTIKNLHNRDYQASNALLVKQEVLRGKWKLNGETLIVGKYGTVLSAQHRLIGFVMAVDAWREDKASYPEISTEPRLETVVVYGIEEDDETVNTIDTGRPRTLADVIFRSIFFANVGRATRKELAKSAQHAVTTLWDRTGASTNSYDESLYRTHAEAIDLLKRHPRLLECIQHIQEEKECRKIIGSLGHGAGLLYLMGCSTSDPKAYNESDPPSEKQLNWSDWETAQDFWVELAAGGEKLKAVSKAISVLSRETPTSQDESIGIVIKAWEIYRKGEIPTARELKLKYTTDEEGEKQLVEFPVLGGIDLGRGNIYEKPDKESGGEPDEEEVKTQARKIRKERNGDGQINKPFQRGNVIWVENGKSEETYKGRLMKPPADGKALVKVAQGFNRAGSIVEVEIKHLSHTQPTL